MQVTTEIFYSLPTAVIALGLALLLTGAMFLGVRQGRMKMRRDNRAEKSQISALQASLMGLVALLIGFSFSLALGRYNERSVAVVEEANAIGTAWLRTDLLDAPHADLLRTALADYTASQLARSTLTIREADRIEVESQRGNEAFARAWDAATAATRGNANPATVAVVSALNDMIDSNASLNAAMTRHVPEIVYYLLAATLLFLGWTVGYSSGEMGGTVQWPVMGMMLLIIVLLAMVLDLDRPRRGLIMVDRTPLVDTAVPILAEAGRPLP